MTAIALFVSTFALVFFLGLQSLFVNHRYYLAAAVNSLAIGTSNLILFKLAPEATGLEIAGFLLGGPLGISAAMWAFHRVRRAA